MVRDQDTGRFLYTERLKHLPRETSWEYIRRSVRRESQVRERFNGERLEVIVGWGADRVKEFLEAYPEYGPVETTDGEARDKVEEE